MIARKSILALAAAALSLRAAPEAWACQNAANLIGNCGFTTTTGGWAVFGSEGVLSFQPADGSQPPAGGTGPGSAEVTATIMAGGFAAMVSQCITNPPPGNYGWGVDSILVSGAVSQCSVAVINSTDATCTALVFPGFQGNMNTASGSWAQSVLGTMNVNPVHHSVFWQVRCTSSGSPFTFRFDDAFFGMGLVPVELTRFTVE